LANTIRAGALIQEIVWLQDIPVASIRNNENNSGVGVFYIHTDHLGTPIKLTRSTDNAIVWRLDADPYGNGTPNEDPDGNGLFVEFNLGFPGQYRDKETGQLYNWNRYYDPQTGRYVTSDPIGLAGGLNTYAYAGGNPVMYADPMGLDYWKEGSVKGEGGYPFHQSICVGKYSGKRTCISFGVAEDNCLMGCKGEVYQDNSAAGPVSGFVRSTSAQADAEIEREFMSMLGTPGKYYLIGNSCRTFSAKILGSLDEKYFPNPFRKSPLYGPFILLGP
jgi:RHS repeat-associated protein